MPQAVNKKVRSRAAAILCWMLCLCHLDSRAQVNYAWAVKQKSGGTMNETPAAMCLGGDGQVYVAINFNSTQIEFKTGLFIDNTNYGYDDVAIVKYDAASGQLLWVKQLHGKYHDRSTSIVSDANGTIYVGGTYRSTYLTVGQDTVWNIEENSSYPQEDMFVIALSEDSGNLKWIKSFGGTKADYLTALQADKMGNVYAGGYYYSSVLNIGNTELTTNNNSNMFLAKLNGTNGSVLWARSSSSGGQGYETLKSISLDEHGNIYAAGEFNSPWLVFDSIMLLRENLIDVFLVRFNVQGVATWGMVYAEPLNDYVQSIALHHNSIYLCIDSTVNYNNGIWPQRSKLMKLNISNKNIEWEKSLPAIRFSRVVIDTSGYIFTCGFASDTVNVDGVSINCVKNYYASHFVLALDTGSGNALWAKTYTKFISSNFIIDKSRIQSICTDHNGTLYTGCYFQDIGIQLDNITCLNAEPTGYDYIVSRINYSYIGVGIKETFSDNKVILYPNPASDVVYVQTDPFINRGSLRVFNSLGVLVMEKQITDNNINMEVSHWPPGMYYLQLSTKKASGVRGFVIQH